MSNVPAARTQLMRLAKDLQLGRITKPMAAAQIRDAISLMRRAPAVRRAPRAKRYVTRKLKWQIIDYAKQHPDAQMADIAEWFQVNQGRVSEILNGKR